MRARVGDREAAKAIRFGQQRKRQRHVQPPRMRSAGRDAGFGLGRRKRPAGPRIERRAVWIARDRPALSFQLGHPRRDRPARAEARIGQPARDQLVQDRAVEAEMLGLPASGPLIGQPEPSEILLDRGDQFGARAARIDVFDAQQATAARPRRDFSIEEGGIGVAEMQAAVRARGEAEDRPGHGSVVRWRHSCGPGVQAMPGVEQIGPSSRRRQTWQPSLHSAQDGSLSGRTVWAEVGLWGADGASDPITTVASTRAAMASAIGPSRPEESVSGDEVATMARCPPDGSRLSTGHIVENRRRPSGRRRAGSGRSGQSRRHGASEGDRIAWAVSVLDPGEVEQRPGRFRNVLVGLGLGAERLDQRMARVDLQHR
ncbi:hypothetical protein EKPJFOCH_3222 [Methylobacterium thuringiense]|uniref:Uncharacterized protein n=1 Tax=Methylobacterium thuringiense TaxID=1003091 RepID=A0ABQ4TN28_9HYPH|nr:hypothetical protein EKPJFOCH_3222 [Methylobacterium thuringiense]